MLPKPAWHAHIYDIYVIDIYFIYNFDNFIIIMKKCDHLIGSLQTKCGPKHYYV
jgi:hypothetical protein